MERKAKTGGGAAKKEVFAATHRRETSSLTCGRAMELKREQGFGEAHGFIFSICSHDPQRSPRVALYAENRRPGHLGQCLLSQGPSPWVILGLD